MKATAFQVPSYKTEDFLKEQVYYKEQLPLIRIALEENKSSGISLKYD